MVDPDPTQPGRDLTRDPDDPARTHDPLARRDGPGRDLLAAYRDERGPSPAAAERLLAALRRDAASGDMSIRTGPSEHVPEDIPNIPRIRARRWLAPVVLLAAAAAITALLVRPQASERHARGEDPSAAYQREPDGETAARARQPAPAPRLEPVLPAQPLDPVAPARPRREPAPAPSLADEMQRMRPAQLALAAGDPRAALAQLDDYARAFPDGRLREEHLALRAIARCQLGEVGAADEAAEFLRERPLSMFAERVRGACEAD